MSQDDEVAGALDDVFELLTEGLSETHRRRLRGVMVSLVTLLLSAYELTADETQG